MARWTPVPVAGGAYSDDCLPWASQDTVNYIPVNAEKAGTRSPSMLRCLPGCTTFSVTGSNAPVRGMRNVEGRLLAVSGNALYRIGTDGAAASLGTIPGVARCSMAHNQISGGHEVAIANGQSGYIYNTATDTLAQITDEGFPGAKVFGFVDGFLMFIEPQGRFFGWSDLAAGTSYNTLDRSEAEAQPDRIVTGIESHGEWVVLGQYSGEFYRNTGSATGTFQRVPGTTMEVGCAGTFTIGKVDNSVVFLGHDGILYRLEGYVPRRISDHTWEQKISRCNMAQGFATVFEDRGHKVFYLTFPDGQTIGFDIATGETHRRKSDGLNRWRMNALVRWQGQWMAGDMSNGRVYQLDWAVQHEAGAEMERRRVMPIAHDNQNAITVNAAEFVVDTGTERPVTYMEELLPGDSWDYTGTFGLQAADVTYGNGVFVTAAQGTAGNGEIWTSSDGDTWTQRVDAATGALTSIAYGDGLFVASQDSAFVVTSPDGVTWTKRATANGSAYVVTIYTGTKFIRAGQGSSSEWSADGIAWNSVARPAVHTARVGLIAANAVALLFTASGSIHRTADHGATWTSGTIASDPLAGNPFTGAATDGTVIRAYKFSSPTLYVYTSADNGVTWTVAQLAVGSGAYYNAGKALYKNGQWMGVGPTTTGGVGSVVTMFKSTDGLVWTPATITNNTDTTASTMNALAASGARTVVVGVRGTLGYALSSVGVAVERTPFAGVATIDIRYSKDGGRNWSNWKQRSLGEVGDFMQRVKLHRMGRGRQWVFDVRVTDPVRADLIAGSIQVEQEA